MADPATGRRYRWDPQSGQTVWVDGPTPAPPQGQYGFQPPHAQQHHAQQPADQQFFTQGAPPKAKRPWFKKKRFIIPLGLVAVGAIATAGGGGDTATTTAEPAASQAASAKASASAPAASKAAPSSAAPKKAAGTKSQQNALRAAENYLEFKGFSKQGLIDQLSSEYGDKYPKADAVWAEQAVRSGQSYLDFQAFSRDGLIQQLSSSAGDKFTKAQATYAADKLGL
jgi:hypothetical protein